VRTPRRARAGFTLAEVAITLLIVSIALVMILQGLLTAEFSAAESHYRRVARQLAQLSLGEVESGLYWEDLNGDGGVQTGTYAEEGYDEFSYEIVFGEDEFFDGEDRNYDENGYHDSWQYEREREERQRRNDDDDEDEVAQPFEKVRVRVTYPKLGKRPNTLVLERWIPWDQVYGVDEDEQRSSSSSSSGGRS